MFIAMQSTTDTSTLAKYYRLVYYSSIFTHKLPQETKNDFAGTVVLITKSKSFTFKYRILSL